MKKYFVKYIGQNWYIAKKDDGLWLERENKIRAHQFTLQEAIYFFNQCHQGNDSHYEVEPVPEEKEIVLLA